MGVLDPAPGYSKPTSDARFARTGGVTNARIQRSRVVSQAVAASVPSHPVITGSSSAINSTSASRIYRYASGAFTLSQTASPITDAAGAVFSKQTGVSSNYEGIMWGPRFGAIGGDATNQFVEVGFAPLSGDTSQAIHIKSDDVLYTLTPEQIAVAGTAPAMVVQLPLPVGETKIFEALGSGWKINYVRVPTASVIFPVNDKRFRIACKGASFVASETSWVNTLGRLTGAEVFQCGVAGTGFLNPGDTSKITTDGGVYNTPARWAGLVATNPDLVILECSGNDSNYPEVTPFVAPGNFAALRDAKIAWLDQFASRLPNTRLIVLDCPPRGYTDSIADKTAINLASTRAAINARPNMKNIIGYHDYVGTIVGIQQYAGGTGISFAVGDRRISSGAVWECVTAVPADAPTTLNTKDWRMFGWYTGTGRIGAPVGNGTRDALLGEGTDETHPSPLGYVAQGTVTYPDILADLERDTWVGVLPRATA